MRHFACSVLVLALGLTGCDSSSDTAETKPAPTIVKEPTESATATATSTATATATAEPTATVSVEVTVSPDAGSDDKE